MIHVPLVAGVGTAATNSLYYVKWQKENYAKATKATWSDYISFI